ncbi:MAG: hypothetical protein ABI200_05850 [Gaiellales bacterium]
MLTPAAAGQGAGGAGTTSVASARPKGFTLEELASRSDALALRIGTRTTASVLMIACVIVILIGAQSLLATMERMNQDIKVMNEQIAISNQGLVVLNTTMESLPKTERHMNAIVKTVASTQREVKTSASSIDAMAGTTTKLHGDVAAIAKSTGSMRGSMKGAADGTGTLATTITTLNADIKPLVATQHRMLLSTRTMRSGLDHMNASLAYTIRIMNWIAAPPTGDGMTLRVELPKETLPPLPGMRAEVKPVKAFERNIWPIYTGP